jgi:hypothetical protein
MIEELAERIWSNAAFHADWTSITSTWLKRQLDLIGVEAAPDEQLRRCAQAASALALVDDVERQRAAFSIAASAFDLYQQESPGLAGVLHLVLTRMGNFPALVTAQSVGHFSRLPFSIAVGEELRQERNTVFVAGVPLLLSDFQRSLWSSLVSGRNVAISAPTSAGKSFLIQAYLKYLVSEEKASCICYLVPTRALISQVSEAIVAWRQQPNSIYVDVITVPMTADIQLPERAIFVLTQERLLATMSAHPTFRPQVVVCDEAQSIAEGSRGVLLHSVIGGLLRRNADAQLIFAGPNVNNLQVYKQLFGLDHLDEQHSRAPSVIQNLIVINTRSPIKGKMVIERMAFQPGLTRIELGAVDIERSLPSIRERLVRVAERFGKAKPSIVYANRPVDAEDVAMGISQTIDSYQAPPNLLELVDFVKLAVHREYDLAKCLPNGVGFHYGRIPTLVRRAVEDAFADGDIRFLVTTSTLIQGVNFPAANLFMCQPKRGSSGALEHGEFWNLAGRAGRLGKEFQGNVFLIDYDEWDNSPAEEGSEIEVVPFLQQALAGRFDALLACALSIEPGAETDDLADVEAAFSRLLIDHLEGRLAETLVRAQLPREQQERLTSALSSAAARVSLPLSVIAATPTVSAIRQQRLANYLAGEIKGGGRNRLEKLLPRHPRDSEAFRALSEIYRVCHEQLLGISFPKLHMRMAAISLSWMRGEPLPQIIDVNHKYLDGKMSSDIRKTLNDIEQEVRFKYLRLTSCYLSVFEYLLQGSEHHEYLRALVSLPTFLEVGASDQSMISFMNLGLSRVTSRLLADKLIDKEFGPAAALEWLRSIEVKDISSSAIVKRDIERALANAA